jgi:DedD protein
MDTAMRDLERIQEHDPEDGRLRQMGVWALAAMVTVALVVAMAVMVGGFRSDGGASGHDPLDALDGLAAAGAGDLEDETVDPTSLSFPHTLVNAENRPEVSAAVAAAEAELAHPAPSASRREQPEERDPSPSVPATLPAAAAAAPTASVLARTVREDPLMARPAERERPEVRPAPAGRDGKYTLQVISYRSADEAELFARTLRDRGHETFVVTADLPERGRHWRVRIGPFDSLADAERYRADFEESEGMNTFIVKRSDKSS